MCKLIHLRITFTLLEFFYNNDALLIYCSNEIFALTAEKALNAFHCTVILLLLKFKNHNYTTDIRIDMKFLRTVINLNQKQVIKKKILDKAVFVESFFIGYNEVLNLECSKFANHVSILIISMRNQHTFQLIIIANFKILESLYKLTVCLGFYKSLYISRLN